MSIFDSIPNAFNAVFPEGEWMNAGSKPYVHPTAMCKTMAVPFGRQMELVDTIKRLAPRSVERYNAGVSYLRTCCGTFCQVQYNPEVEAVPRVIWSDLEGDLEWFAKFVDDLFHDDYSDVGE